MTVPPGLRQLTADLRAGTVSARETVAGCLDAIARADPVLRAFITVTADQARQRAAELDEAQARGTPTGPLHGIPVAVKDCIDVAGTPTTCGTPSRRDAVARTTAASVAALVGAGAVVVGKTNLHEWMFGATSSNPHYGVVRNPWDPERIPGGSSGGSAVAVATGMALLALGTDTGGSIRIPAGYCGVAGLRATPGRFSTDGVHPQSWTLDTVGPLARTVDDLAVAYDVLAATGRLAPGSADAARLDGTRVGVLREVFLAPGRMDPAVHDCVERALRDIAGVGATVVELEVPALAEVPAAFFAVALAETAAVHSGPARGDRESYGEDIRALLALGDAVPAVDYIAGLRFRSVLREQFAAALAGVDCIVAPATPDRAEPIGVQTVRWPDGTTEPFLEACARYCLPASLAGLPVVTLPCGIEDGLPVGLQVMGAPRSDAQLLSLGTAFQEELGWPVQPSQLVYN